MIEADILDSSDIAIDRSKGQWRALKVIQFSAYDCSAFSFCRRSLAWRPAECFVCRPTLQEWLEWGKDGVGRGASLVLTREPTPAERNLLISSRLTYSIWLAESPGDHPPPALFLFTSGKLTDSATGDRQVAAALNRW